VARLAPIVLLVGALGLAGCADGRDADGSGLPDGASAGAKVLVDTGCLSCHALAGEGNAPVGGKLDAIGAKRSADELDAVLSDPPAGMPAYDDRLSPGDRRALVDYLAARR
jgi:mono/diheme cytochrome c family protein